MRIHAKTIACALLFAMLLAAANCSARTDASGRAMAGGDRKGLPAPDDVYRYRHVDGADLEGDFYLPSVGEPPYPVVVLIHGGGWRSGDKRGMLIYAAKLIDRGYACFSINYRLTPEGRFPNNVTDCKAAVQWLRRWADRLDIDPERMAAMGGSAGGHLSAFIGATDDDDGFNAGEYATSGRVQAVVPLYGVFDFTALEGRRHRLNQYAFLHPVHDTVEEHLAKISPSTYVTVDDPPVFLIHGADDSLIPAEQSEMYHELLRETGVRSELLLVENAGHGLKPAGGEEMSPSWDEAINAAIDFLDEVL